MYDVSLPLRAGGLVYPGDPPIRIGSHSAIARGDPANVSTLAFGSHTGTHVDAPRHFIEGDASVDQIPLARLIGPALVLDLVGTDPEIEADELKAHDLRDATRILLRTHNSDLLERTEFSSMYRSLAVDGAEYLLGRGVVLVGIDYLSIERFGSEDHPVHHLLLERGVVIVEGLNLSGVPAGSYQLWCLPLRLAGLDGAPARVVLVGRGGEGVDTEGKNVSGEGRNGEGRA
jgi:arylformamidase